MQTECNVVTKMLEPGSPFETVSVTTKMVGFGGCVVWAFLYNMVSTHHGVDEAKQAIEHISASTWTTFHAVLKQTLEHDTYKHRIRSLITTTAKISRKRFFPYVGKLAEKLGIHVDNLYEEIVKDQHKRTHARLSYMDIKTYKKGNRASNDVIHIHMVKFHPSIAIDTHRIRF